MITDGAARRIASDYHNGQTSASYSFASTGTITDVDSLIRDLQRGLSSDQLDDPDLRALTDYITQTGPRGSVSGWAGLWD